MATCACGVLRGPFRHPSPCYLPFFLALASPHSSLRSSARALRPRIRPGQFQHHVLQATVMGRVTGMTKLAAVISNLGAVGRLLKRPLLILTKYRRWLR